MTKSKKNFAIVVALITLLVALGSIFAIFASPVTILEAAELTEAQLAERRANPGLYKTGTMTLKTSWADLISSGEIRISNGSLKAKYPDSDNLAGDLVCGSVDGLTSLHYAFRECPKLTSLDFSNLDTSNVMDMSKMIYRCTSVTSIIFGSKFNTSKVTDMSEMFYGSESLTSLDVSNFDTSKVITMDNMFNDCPVLTSLDVSNFNTSSVTNMCAMFASCSSLTSLNVSNFNTSKVKNMGYMFGGCSKLTTLDLSNFDTSKVELFGMMFMGCSSLKSLDLQNWYTDSLIADTEYGLEIAGMFYGCSSLTSLDIRNFDTSKVESMTILFANCSSLKSITFGKNFKTSNIKDMTQMFYGCSKLVSLDLHNFDTSNVTNMSRMFADCTFSSLILGDTFVINDNCNASDMFITEESGSSGMPKTLGELGFSEEEQAEVFKCDTIDARIDKVCEILTKMFHESGDLAEDEVVDKAWLEANNAYDMILAMVQDQDEGPRAICSIVAPKINGNNKITLTPATNTHYALETDPATAITELSSATNGQTLKLYYDDTNKEVAPSTPTTPSTGVATDITMIIIALASVISLVVVATKKKRVAR